MKRRPCKYWIIPVLAAVFVVAVSAGEPSGASSPGGPAAGERPKPSVTFKPQEMADALHAVIAADREVYAKYLEQLASVAAAEGKGTNPPIPAHLLRQASEAIQTKGAEFHYILRSLWPINPRNAPETEIEAKGLKAVLEHPDQAFYSEESLGGRRYFTAVYADRAVVQSCANCHNRHPKSSKTSFKTGDVMGGLIVRVPLEF